MFNSQNLHLTAKLGFGNEKYHVGLSLIEFEEDNVIIIYSPALDLSGYGYNQEQAKNSFSEALKEFLKYTTNKNTLDKVLKNLGWAIKGSKKNLKFNPPKDSDLISLNPLYNDIVKLRPITVQTHVDPVPEFIIKNALKQLGLTKKDFTNWI